MPPSAKDPLSGPLIGVLATFLGLGLLLAFTPCVLPMVPVLAGMLARSGERLSAGRGFVLSGIYALAVAMAYATLGLAAAWSGRNLQVALQTPMALGLLAAAFATLALSMFGAFDLAMPAGAAARLSRIGGRRFGALGGAAVMGFTSALIVGPCVTPPLAAALLYVPRRGTWHAAPPPCSRSASAWDCRWWRSAPSGPASCPSPDPGSSRPSRRSA